MGLLSAALRPPSKAPRRTALALGLALFAIYNANGREMGVVDSQPAKFTVRELVVSHTLRLDRVVSERSGLARRPAFARDREGHYRSAYSMMPVFFAAVPAFIVHVTGLVDLDAPLAPNLVAKFTASALTASAVALVFLALTRLVSPVIAVVTAVGLGLGTNFWPVASQTLWQHESVAFGAAIALWAWLRPDEPLKARHLFIGALGLAIAGVARPQVTPMIGVMLLWIAAREGWRRAVGPAVIVAVIGALNLSANYVWYGHVLAGVPQLEAASRAVHDVTGTLSATPWVAAAGLLASPSRGLLVFSPIVLAALAGLGYSWKTSRDLPWLSLAVCLQFLTYSFYAVWWGGHTYGPRYMLDVLVPLAPIAAMGAARLARARWSAAAGIALLVWSIAVAGAGAFVYPNDLWNQLPEDVDLRHDRLWDLHDSQIVRVVHSRFSPQNFGLFTRAAVR